ncbi:splicing factor U2af small subunit B-like protein [Tanacetum coccineum]
MQSRWLLKLHASKKINKDLRRQLFKRRRRIRRRSHSLPRHQNHDDRPRGGGHGGSDRRGSGGYSKCHSKRSRRSRSRSLRRRSGHSRSTGEKRNMSLVREGNTKRRAKIEKWNREKEQAKTAPETTPIKENSENVNDDDGLENEDRVRENYHEPQQQKQQQDGKAYDY